MRIVLDGFDVSAIGGKGVTVVRTTTPKGYKRRKPKRVELGSAAGGDGMFAESVKAGSLVYGQRVTGMRRGMVDGRHYVSAQLADGSWTEALYYGQRVPGTRKRADLLAGPVGAGRGMRANKPGWNEGDSPTDRNARRIDYITYG